MKSQLSEDSRSRSTDDNNVPLGCGRVRSAQIKPQSADVTETRFSHLLSSTPERTDRQLTSPASPMFSRNGPTRTAADSQPAEWPNYSPTGGLGCHCACALLQRCWASCVTSLSKYYNLLWYFDNVLIIFRRFFLMFFPAFFFLRVKISNNK